MVARPGGQTDTDAQLSLAGCRGATGPGDLYCGAALTPPPGPCGTRRRCPAQGRRGCAGATLMVARGPPGPRSRPRRGCGGRTRPAKQRGGWAWASPSLPPLQSPHPPGGACAAAGLAHRCPCAPSPSETKLKCLWFFATALTPCGMGGPWAAGGMEKGWGAILTPGNTGTDVFPPRFTVRPSLRISRFRPRAPGSPPAGRGQGGRDAGAGGDTGRAAGGGTRGEGQGRSPWRP